MNNATHITGGVPKGSYRVIVSMLALVSAITARSQTNPAPQGLPYTQDFSAVAHNSTTLPAGWQGWRIGFSASGLYRTDPATADLPLLASSTAATNTGGVHNYNGKLGFLTSASVDIAIALVINTSGRTDIQVDYDLMTIRNPYSAFPSNTRRSGAKLQYRVGTTGNFITTFGSEYQTNTTNQTSAVTTPQNLQSYSTTLPSVCNDQPIVQLRWVTRDISGSGSRPSIAVNNISITGPCIPASASISYDGSPYCSDAGTASPTLVGTSGGTYSASGITIDPITGAITLNSSSSGTVTYLIAAENGCPAVATTAGIVISAAAMADAGGPYTSLEAAPTAIAATTNGPGSWSGGQGTFTNANSASTTYSPTVAEIGFTVTLTWTTVDPDGGGPCAAASDQAVMNVDFMVYTPMFDGGAGRGDAQGALPIEGLGDFIYAGGSGRGDVSSAYVAPPITADIYQGGSGRGDAADHYQTVPIASSIFGGGSGRGDVADIYQPAPLASSIFSGGSGRGDVADLYLPALLASSIFSGGSGRGDVADLYQPAALASSIFSGGSGRGDVAHLYQAPALASSIFAGGGGRGDVADLFLPAPLASSIFSGGIGRGDVADLYTLPLSLQLAVKAFLEGPYDQGQDRMNDDLRSLGLIPTTEPYSALGYFFVGGGGEVVQSSVFNSGGGGNRIVDWVVVELRDAGDPTVVVSSRCALIQRDGDVVDLDGSSPVSMVADPAAYNVALRHRNHLGAMTANAYPLSTAPMSIDLTMATTTTYGTGARTEVGASWALWAGDVDFDGQLKYTGALNDRDPILFRIGGTVATNVVNGIYSSEDVDLDGRVMYTGAGNDRDPILFNIGGTVATNVRVEQLP